MKTYDDAVKMIKAGASRLGTSSGAAIVSGGGTGHECVNCGACKKTCPTGNATIVKNCY